MHNSDTLRTLVEDALAQLPLPSQPARLYEPIRYALTLGGKRLRPVMMLMAYELFREDSETILPQALAMETYHNFTLLHDDVMDHASVRRGKPCVHVRWDENTAILSGDAMLALAYQLYGNVPGLSTFHEATLGVCEGQQYDMDFETCEQVSEDDYMEMIRLKTSLLFSCSMKIGAQLADASEADAQALYDFGRLLGLAFQLQDDWLDVYGDPAVFGKQTGGDIMEGKRTWLLIQALNLANPQQHKALTQWLNTTDAPREEKVRAVTDIYNALGIGALCQARVEALFAQALEQLASVSVSEERKQPLRALALQIMGRKS